jgi:hypothetical protein
MPGDRSSSLEPVKLSSFHVAVSSFAALAGVIIAGWQVFGPPHPQAPPVNVTLTIPQAAAPVSTDDTDSISTSSIDLAKGAQFTSADKEEDGRYSFDSIFDGKPDSYITLSGSDSELNVMVNFAGDAAREVTAISYTPPPGVPPDKLATSVDVVVLPDGDAGAAGHPVYSFTLQTTPGTQTFAIPGHHSGKAVWLRVAGNPNTKGIAIGDFGIIREHITP